MDIAMLIVTFGGVVIAAVAAWAAIVQARTAVAARIAAEDARNESQTARDEAVRLAAEANEAFKRSAAAQERANEIAEAAIPKKQVHFQVRHSRGSVYVVMSDGDIGAKNVILSGAGEAPGFINPVESQPRDLVVGDSMEFYVMRVNGPTPRLRIDWDDPVTGEPHDIEVNIV